MALTIASTHEADRSTVLRLRGLVDLTGAAELRAAISAAIGRRPRAIVVDLSGVERLDSSAVGTLVVAERICRDLQIDLTVRHHSSLPVDHPIRTIVPAGSDQSASAPWMS